MTAPRPRPRTYPETALAAFLVFLGVKPDDPDLAAKTAQATRALVLALAAVETRLDRSLEFVAGELEEFAGVYGSVQVRRYPLEAVDLVTVDGAALDPGAYQVDKRRGIVRTGGGDLVAVTYAGGYAAFPADLDFAIQAIAAGLFPMVAEGGASSTLTGPPVSRISIPDVGTVEFNVTAGDAGQAQVFGPLAPAYESVLLRYRSESAVGGA